MASILSILEPAENRLLTTLERVKLELNITDSSSDEILTIKIGEASSDIEAHLGYVLARETVSETFWDVPSSDGILLRRVPVASLTSATVDGDLLEVNRYRLNYETGVLSGLDEGGYPAQWYVGKDATIVYVAGYVLPGDATEDTPSDLPMAIQGACVDLVQDYWFARGRDGMVKSDDVIGVRRVDYWVGAVGSSSDLPPGVVAKLAPFRRRRL